MCIDQPRGGAIPTFRLRHSSWGCSSIFCVPVGLTLGCLSALTHFFWGSSTRGALGSVYTSVFSGCSQVATCDHLRATGMCLVTSFSWVCVSPHSFTHSRVSCEHVFIGPCWWAVHSCSVSPAWSLFQWRKFTLCAPIHCLGSRPSLHLGALWVLPRSSHWLV